MSGEQGDDRRWMPVTLADALALSEIARELRRGSHLQVRAELLAARVVSAFSQQIVAMPEQHRAATLAQVANDVEALVAQSVARTLTEGA